MIYPDLGSQVSYVRQTPQGEIITGFAQVRGFAIDGSKRAVAHLKDPNEEHAFNIDIHCVNPTPEFIEKFKALSIEVKAVQDEGNAKAQEIIGIYNQKIVDLYTGLLGEPLDIA